VGASQETSIVERQTNTFSDFLAHQYMAVRDENLFLRGELAKVKEDVACTKASKDKVEVKGIVSRETCFN
jgi:hypothetical protein